MNGSTAPARKKMTHKQRELSLTHKANSEEQPQTQKPAANRPAEVPSWANPHEHDLRSQEPPLNGNFRTEEREKPANLK